MQPTDALAQFIALAADPSWVRLQLTQGPPGAAQRVQLRPVQLRGALHWQAVWRHPSKDLTENWPASDALQRLASLFDAGWRSAALWRTDGHWQLDRKRKGDWRLVRHSDGAVEMPSAAHDRSKERALDLAHPVWKALGIAESGREGQPRLVPAMARKWKQINRFVEVLEPAMRTAGLLQERQLRVADFGCGRGYLTFAVALYLARIGVPAEVLGVELREDLVAETETLARQFDIAGLRFAQGDVGHAEVRPLDLMIALHACDTATDHAIHHGLRAGARVIVCAPCCHKQLRGQLQPPHALRPLFKHGVHLGQEAEMLTDGLRALLLESQGYETQVFEFVSLEHTQKNKMILAVRRGSGSNAGDREAAMRQVEVLKDFWQLREHCLEQLLKTGLP